MNPDNTSDYCRLKAAEPGTSFYYATLYHLPETRRKLFCIHAFSNELAGIISECTDPGVARMKLAWWYEEVQRLYDRQPRHPVTRETLYLFGDLEKLNHFFTQLISFYDQQVNLYQPQTYGELMEFLQREQGLLWELSADICTYQNPQTPQVISELGSRITYFRILQDTPFNEQMNRNYFPIKEENGKNDKTGLYAVQIERLINEMENINRKLPAVDRKSQKYAIILANITCATCREIAKSGYRLSDERITLTPLRKFWIAWRTHRREC